MGIDRWFFKLPLRLRSLFKRSSVEDDLNEELEYHIDQQVQEYIAKGVNSREARNMALRRMAGVEQQKERCRDTRRVSLIEDFVNDIRYAARGMIKRPAFFAIAIFTLALGIGPITAIFTLVHSVIWKSLPYKDSDRLVRVSKNFHSMSVPDFVDLHDQNQTFDQIATFSVYSVFNLTGQGEPLAVQTSEVSAGLFTTLGIKPLLGRGFLPEEDKPGSASAVVLGNTFWKEKFAADPNIIGKAITLNARPFIVIGVMPSSFEFPISPAGTQIWVNTSFNSNDPSTSRNDDFLNVIGRLKPGISIEQAEANLNTILQPEYASQTRVNLVPLRDEIAGEMRKPLLILLGAIAFVLLIACANVANLLLIRSASRQKEVAIRLSLGAGQFRLLRQFLTESILLTVIGGALGLLLASLSLKLLISFSPIAIPRISEVVIDSRVLAFLSVVVLSTGAIFGTLSAFKFSENDLCEFLKTGTGRSTSGTGRQRLRSGLVIGEIALSLVLLLGTSLMIRSFIKLVSVDPGFKSEGVLCINVTLPERKYSGKTQRAIFVRQAIDQLKTLPGVKSVASAAFIPMTGPGISLRFASEGDLSPERDQLSRANIVEVSSEFFRTLEIPVIAGRAFVSQDDDQKSNVAIVNQTLVRRFFSGKEVIGKRIQLQDPDDGPAPWLEIVGIVHDIKQAGLGSESEPEIYVPHVQDPPSFMSLFVRADGDPANLTNDAKRAIQSVDSEQPTAWITTLDAVLANSISDRRGMMFLLTVFGLMALLLAGIGVYGVVAHSVSMRTREIGIRMALGAQSNDVLRLIIREGISLALAGICLGLIGAFLSTQIMSSMLFGIGSTDPIAFTSGPLILIAVVFLACYLPARRAAKVDPMTTLRFE